MFPDDRPLHRQPNDVVEWLTFLRVWDVPGSDLNPETGYLG